MNEPRTQQEPSMEEILASIRRIISEDAEKDGDVEMQSASEQAQPAQKAQPAEPVEPAREADTVEPAPQPEPEPVREPEPQPEPEPIAEPQRVEEEVLELTEIIDEDAVEPEPLPVARPEPARRRDSESDNGDRLVSDDTADATREAFARLIRDSTSDEKADQRAVYLGDGAKTIEDLVRAELRPMLRQWLDAHLRDVVDEIVRREVEHIVHSFSRR